MGTSAGSTSTTHTTDTFNALAGITEEGFGGTSLLAYSRTADGAVWLDADYVYQYDLFGRLVQVNARGDLQITEGQPQGTIGPWIKHWTYDALGRVIRVQSPMPAAEGMAPQSYTERYYYDGDRRIVRLASIVQLEAGGKPILIKDEAGNGYLYQLAMVQDREWVWDPDGGDALLAQIDLLDNDRLAYVLGSLSGDPAVLIDEVGTPLARYGFDPYGNVLELDTLAPHAALPIGHKGLFFDRLDQPTTTNPLAAGAKGHYFNRARTYAPKLGRFLQPDPNATGLPVTSDLAWMGGAVEHYVGCADPDIHFGSGMNVMQYVDGNPASFDDPQGCFLGMIGLGLAVGLSRGMDAISALQEAHTGLQLCFALNAMLDAYAVTQMMDVAWAGDWRAADDAYSRSIEFATQTGSWTPEDDCSVDEWDTEDDGPALGASRLAEVSRATYEARRSAFGAFRRSMWEFEASKYKAEWLERVGEEGVARMQMGLNPRGLVVHHKKALMHNGRNTKNNLVIMPRNTHQSYYQRLHNGKRMLVPPKMMYRPPSRLRPGLLMPPTRKGR